jgi:hypothetical protein
MIVKFSINIAGFTAVYTRIFYHSASRERGAYVPAPELNKQKNIKKYKILSASDITPFTTIKLWANES